MNCLVYHLRLQDRHRRYVVVFLFLKQCGIHYLHSRPPTLKTDQGSCLTNVIVANLRMQRFKLGELNLACIHMLRTDLEENVAANASSRVCSVAGHPWPGVANRSIAIDRSIAESQLVDRDWFCTELTRYLKRTIFNECSFLLHFLTFSTCVFLTGRLIASYQETF